jgi:hypothetical protein
MSMQTDPAKKTKSLKPAIRDAVKMAVRSGDPSEVVQFIKQNKKDFISGVYSSVFMSSVRKQMTGNSAAVAVIDKASSSNGVDNGRAEKRSMSREEGSNKRAKTSQNADDAKETKAVKKSETSRKDKDKEGAKATSLKERAGKKEKPVKDKTAKKSSKEDTEA